MADVNIDPFGDHDKTPGEPMGENIPLTPVGGSTWEPEREQETSFRGQSQRTRIKKDYVKELYQKLSKKYERIDKTSEAFHTDYFNLKMIRGGMLRMVKELAKILGKEGLIDLGFDPTTFKITAQEVEMLNRVEEELPSESDVAKADDIELQ